MTPDPVKYLDEVWATGDENDALAEGDRLVALYPENAALRERLALVHVVMARQSPTTDHLAPALRHLNAALHVEPQRVSALEIRGHLLLLIAHRMQGQGSVDSASSFDAAARDFLVLIESGELEEPRRSVACLEAARALFLAERERSNDPPEYGHSAELFAMADSEQYEPADWFFRGIAVRAQAERSNRPEDYRQGAACFLRAIEEEAHVDQSRYFAADCLLSLEEPTLAEFALATSMVEELAEGGRSEQILVRSIKQRLQLRARLLGNRASEEDTSAP